MSPPRTAPRPQRRSIAGSLCRARGACWLAAAALAGCAGVAPFGGETVTGRPSVAAWMEAPEEYAARIAGADRSRRARERQAAIDYLLRDPRAESALRLQLVFAAAITELEEANAALDELASARAQARSAFARSALAGVVLSTQNAQAGMRAALESENQLTVERGRRERVERDLDRAARERARLEQALNDAQGKLRALMSIEQQLQREDETG